MSRPFSAYAALELEPGADRAAVDAAYRRLIKLHHPDRSGGDEKRAAEINRAYRELKGEPLAHPAPAASAGRRRSRRRRSPRIRLWPLAILAGAVLLLLQGKDIRQVAPGWASRLSDMVESVPASSTRSRSPSQALLDAPLNEDAVAAAVGDAVRLARSGDDGRLIGQSRDCHRRMRAEPSLLQLDFCSAFDIAAVALEDRDPDHDSGPFNASSVTARQMTAASLLSNDYLAIERRLNRIRNRVEMALMPSAPLQNRARPPAVELTDADFEDLQP
jgi:hypothetical protein